MGAPVRPGGLDAAPLRAYASMARWVLAALALAFIVIVPFVANQSQVFFWENVGVQVLFATSVNLLIGYANMPSFGQAAFYGVGAYTVAELASRWPPVLALVAAAVFGGMAAFVLGLVAVRTRGTAFSMVTLAVGQGLYLVAYQTSTFGGENGLPGIAALGLSQTGLWFVLMAFLAAGMFFYYRVVHSPFGDTLKGIRDDPKRAAFLGIPVFWRRLTAFTFAGVGAALAGGMLAYAGGIVTPDQLYWTQSGYPIIMALVGGTHAFWGPAVGALVVTWLLQVLGQMTPAYLLPVGFILLGVLVLAPNGLASLAEWAARRWGFVRGA